MKNQIAEEIEKTYIITPDGRCINRDRGTELKFFPDRKGYLKSRLWAPGLSKNKDKRIPFRLHRLVAQAHIKDFDPRLQVNHKNGIKTDNRVENLEMVTNAENALHGWNVLPSTERRQKVSSLFTGRKHTNKTKEKLSVAHRGLATGRKHTEETKRKMSQVRGAYWKKMHKNI